MISSDIYETSIEPHSSWRKFLIEVWLKQHSAREKKLAHKSARCKSIILRCKSYTGWSLNDCKINQNIKNGMHKCHFELNKSFEKRGRSSKNFVGRPLFAWFHHTHFLSWTLLFIHIAISPDAQIISCGDIGIAICQTQNNLLQFSHIRHCNRLQKWELISKFKIDLNQRRITCESV